MNSKTLASHYTQLTAEERFRLICAAGDRGDEPEQDRLTRTGQRIHLSMQDHAPYAHAFQELLFITYIELLEDAALYLEFNARTDKELRDSVEAASTPKRKTATTSQPKGRTPREDSVEYPAWHRTGRTAYAAGFFFKVKLEGWKLFCLRLNVSPIALWEQMDLPGLDRLKRAVALADVGAAFPSAAEMTLWVNEVRPAGDPEHSEADVITAERFAASLEAAFRERVRWWGE
jgi:hypothetical protein